MVTYNAGEETATVTLKPMAVGEVDITIKVMDNGGIENGGMDMTETTFKVAVVDNKMAVSATEFKNNLFVKLYPNPTKDIVQLDLGTNPANHVDIAVFTTTGEQIIHKQFNSGENVSFNMNNHVSGMYFVKVMVDGKQTVKKLILDRR